ncbi:hypothetical protein SRHO_G00124020 [Serrasalmus rhombeus]
MMGWKSTGDIKRCLVYKLIYLENARNAMNEELCCFTEKTSEEIEEFLNSPASTRMHVGANLLKTLDAKCHVIKELMTVFEGLKSALEPHSMRKLHLPHRISLSPQRVLHFNHKRSRQNGVFIPNVLKFGPLLQNVIQESSITKAVQIIGATLSLQHMVLSLESEKDQSSGKISTNYGTEIELLTQDDSKKSEMESAKHNMQENIAATEAQTPRNVADISPRLTQNVTSHIFEQQLGNEPEVQHQKQTSSQLMRFLRMNGKTKNLPDVSFFGSVERAFVLVQQQKRNTEAMDLKKITLYTTQKRQSFSEMKVSGPIFKVKNSCAGFVTYSCIIATHSELWDIGDISTEVKNSSQSSVSDEKMASPYCNDSKELDLFGLTVCTSSGESVASDNLELQCDLEELTDGATEDEYLLRIPEFQIRKYEEMPVLVSHVVSPSRFYIQHKDSRLQKLSEIMARTSYKSCAERNCVPDIGTYVIGWFSEQKLWCRAQVTKICGMKRGSSQLCTHLDGVKNLEVEVRRIDYGDSACLSLSNVKELCGEVAKVPVQALQVSLVNVNPVNGQSWSAQAINWFKDKVSSRTLYARLYPEGNRVGVELFMEKGKIGAMRRGASLSLRLAQNGHARHEKMSMRLKKIVFQVMPKSNQENSHWNGRSISSPFTLKTENDSLLYSGYQYWSKIFLPFCGG